MGRNMARARHIGAACGAAFLFAVPIVVVSQAVSGAVGNNTVSGGATGVQATGIISVPGTPTVTLPPNGAQQSASAGSIGGNPLVTSSTASVTTVGNNAGAANEQVQSSASVQGFDMGGGGGLPANAISGNVSSTCTADAAGSSGSTAVSNFDLLGTPTSVPASPAPNTNVPVPAGLSAVITSITVNQQTQADGPGSATITVDGLDVQIVGGTTMVIAQSECGVAGPDIENPPTATSISPTTGATNGGTPVTITGSGFVVPSTVTFGGTPGTNVTVLSPTEIRANTPPGGAGAVSVAVATPSGTATAPQQFTYVTVPSSPGPNTPTVSGISPTNGDPSGSNTMVIEGSNLCQVSSVYFGATPAPVFTSSADCNTLTVIVPAGTGTVSVTVTTLAGSVTAGQKYTYVAPGYWMVARDGGVFAFGGAQFFGSTGSMQLNQPIVAMATTPDDGGYWLFAADGGVFAFGDAQFYGSVPGVLGSQHRTLNEPIVAAESSSDGKGYRLFAGDGGVFDFGDAQFVGSLPGLGVTLNKPITAATSAPFGQGYWLTAADGGVFCFGSATFEGSLGGRTLNAPVASMATTPDGEGYWLAAADGGVFNFGDSAYYGSMGGQHLNAAIAALAADPAGSGYWLFGTDGGVFTFGTAAFEGSLGGTHLNQPIVGGVGA